MFDHVSTGLPRIHIYPFPGMNAKIIPTKPINPVLGRGGSFLLICRSLDQMDQLQPVFHSQLLVDIVNMTLDGFNGDKKIILNILITFTFENQTDDLLFPAGDFIFCK